MPHPPTPEDTQEISGVLRFLADHVDDAVVVLVPAEDRVVYASRAWETIWGRPIADLYRRPALWIESIAPEDRAQVAEARDRLKDTAEFRMDYRISRPDGAIRWIQDRSFRFAIAADRIAIASVAVDITTHKQLESQLLQAQKMEAVGQLAGGVAHDFNNVLTVVTGYARLLLDKGDAPPEMVEPLMQIYTAGVRAANLTRQLLMFSRKQAMHRQILDFNDVIDEIGSMLRRLIGEHIKLEIIRSATPPIADADAAMIEQVLMNLAVNARDAMLEGGTLSIGVQPIRIEKTSSHPNPAARPGDFVCITVRDTGCGISPENLPRIFEPFFTTKDAGHGTGLGLATVFGVVRQHEGWIEVESKVGVGTCFQVLLPAAEEASAPRRYAARVAQAAGGSETVLLVEDETAVREFGTAVLRSHGYRVLQASSGLEALEVWKWHAPRISLLFSDLVLPDGIGGLELAERLRREKPTLHVIITSGYASEGTEQRVKRPTATQFVRKPYKPQVLAQAVRDALDGNYNRE